MIHRPEKLPEGTLVWYWDNREYEVAGEIPMQGTTAIPGHRGAYIRDTDGKILQHTNLKVADTKEELIVDRIDKINNQIEGLEKQKAMLNAIREVPVPQSEQDLHFWVGFYEHVKSAFRKSSTKSKLLHIGDRHSAACMIGYRGKSINIHWVEGWEDLADADYIRAMMVNMRILNVITETLDLR